MDPQVLDAIARFFDSTSELRRLGVIRSDKYLGDLAEYICSHLFEIELAASGRQVGFDGTRDGRSIQIKYHGSSTRTNVDFGDPDQYQEALVVLGPASRLRPAKQNADFLIYRFSSAMVREHAQRDGLTYSCGGTPFQRDPDRIFSLSRPKEENISASKCDA